METAIADEHIYYEQVFTDEKPWTWVVRVYPKPVVKKKSKKPAKPRFTIHYVSARRDEVLATVYRERDELAHFGYSDWELSLERWDKKLEGRIVKYC